jgi:streptogramin lyase
MTFRPRGLWHLSRPGSFPYGIAVAADGSVWFTEKDVGKIGRIAP